MTDHVTFLPCGCRLATHCDGARVADWELNFLHDLSHTDGQSKPPDPV